jgi:hypothetical protein
MNRRRWAVLAAIAAGVVVLVVINLAIVDDPAPRRAAERCDPGDLGCYEGRYARLVRDAGPERAFRAFKADYKRDQLVRAKCHTLAHVVGRAAGERFGDVAEAYRRGDRFCASGYYHGAMEAIVAGPAGSRALDRPDEVCDGLPRASVDQGNCSHGLGHGYMAVRANDVPASLRLCDRLSADYERGNCYDGVFMQNVMARDDPRHPSRYLDPNRPLRLCWALAARYRRSCLNRQVLYALEVTGGDFRTIFGLCRRLGGAARAQCDRQLGDVAAGVNIGRQPDVAVQASATAQICRLAPDTGAWVRCAEGAVGYFVYYYNQAAEAKAFCRVLGSLRRRCAELADQRVRDARRREPRS